jgi:hypothetical protein
MSALQNPIAKALSAPAAARRGLLKLLFDSGKVAIDADALMAAVRTGDVDLVQQLLEAKASAHVNAAASDKKVLSSP